MKLRQGPANFVSRLVAYVLDVLLLAVPAGALVTMLGKGAHEARPTIGVVLVLAALAYFVVLEGGPSGATLGKRAARLRVVAADGGPLGYRRALMRTLARLLSAFPCYAGFLWCLIERQGRCWHDMLAGSRVIPLNGRRYTA